MQSNAINLDLDILESEHLIGRLKLIELLERQSPYRDSRDRVERRFSQALSAIPEGFHQAALAIFASTLFITKQMLDDAWRYCWTEFCRRAGGMPERGNLLILELDRDLLRDDFYRANALVGRLQDNLPLRSSYDLVDALMQLESGYVGPELRVVLPEILQRPFWLLLIDVSISGGSAVAELDRLHRIRRMLYPDRKTSISALIQLASEQATAELEKTNWPFVSAIKVPSTCALNSHLYSIVNHAPLIQKMRELCEWFAEKHILPTDYRLATMSREQNNWDIARFGFEGMGWNIVTHRNTPNNSLPILWFRPPNDAYRPPFERIDSRIGPSWLGRKKWLERLETDVHLRGKIIDRLNGLREEVSS